MDNLTSFIHIVSEQMIGMLRKLPNFIEQILPIVIKMMADIEDDNEWNEHNDEDDEGL